MKKKYVRKNGDYYKTSGAARNAANKLINESKDKYNPIVRHCNGGWYFSLNKPKVLKVANKTQSTSKEKHFRTRGDDVLDEKEKQEFKGSKKEFSKLMAMVAIIYIDALNNNLKMQDIVKSTMNFTDETISSNDIGLATKENVIANSNSFTEQQKDDLVKLGIVKIDKYGKKYDFFRDRIIFPIVSNLKKESIINGFTGRDITNKSKCKYLHSKSNKFFTLRQCLANYNEEAEEYVITEGIKDALKLEQLKIKGNAVGTLGSSISARQISMIKHARKLTIMMDNDEAGRKATTDIAKKLLENCDISNIQVAVMVTHNDPSDLVDACRKTSDIKDHVMIFGVKDWIISSIVSDIKSIKGDVERNSAAEFAVNEFFKNAVNKHLRMKTSIINNIINDNNNYC